MKTLIIIMAIMIASVASASDIVSMTILAEARGEGPDGMAAVAACIKQRSLNRSMTPEAVCLEKKQFSCWNGKRPADLEHLLNLPQAKTAIWLSKNLHRLNRAKIGFADHYHADYVKPYWAKNQTPTAIIGKHIFYKLK